MPYYSQNGRVAYFSAFKDHCSFFWITSSDKETFSQELVSQKIVGNTLQIPKGQKVPTTLIIKLVKEHLRSNEARKKK